MNAAARSVFLFGIYLMIVGAIIVGAPNTFLSISGQAPTTEPWLRVLGVLTLAIGQYYMVGGKANDDSFIRATVRVRVFVVIAFTVLVVLKRAPLVLLGFGAVDGLGALWTFSARKRAVQP